MDHKEKGFPYKQIGNRRLKDQKPVVDGLCECQRKYLPPDETILITPGGNRKFVNDIFPLFSA